MTATEMIYMTAQTRKMNILQIMSDQHMADAMGVAGHAQAITPNLDRLAASGMRCTRAYTNNPVCTPTRVSVLSGRYCHNHGYFALGGPVPSDDLPDFLSHLGGHGYHTAAVGKLHLPRDPHHWLANRVDYHAECCNDTLPENPYVQWARSQGLGDQIDFGSIPELPGKQQNEARPSKLTYKQCVEGYTNQLAMQFIDGCEGEPWAMQVSYFRPHQCYTPPKQFWDLYDDNLDLPFGWKDYDTSGRTPDFTEFVERWRDRPGMIEPTDPESRFRRVWRGYLACISMVDHAVGELLDHLQVRGLADHTAVMYHSDHGAYSGMYGLPEKAPGIASDQVCRIPMIWRVPGVTKPGQTTDAFVEQVDIAPTFAALAGAEPMPDPDGFDLTPILRGEDRPFRDCAVTENLWSKAVRWDNWRFVHYHRMMYDGQDHGELYDLDADPLETNNLYHDPAFRETREEGRRRILEWLTHSTRVVTQFNPLPPRPGEDWPQGIDRAEIASWQGGVGKVRYT